MPVLNLAITSDSDDGFDNGSAWDSEPYSGSAGLSFQVRKTPSADFQGGVRFQNVTIPQGATINSATLTLTNESGGGSADSLDVYGDDVDNAPAWGASSRPQSGFTDTTASASVLAPSTTAGATYAFDVASIVQEIVDRGGWLSGNAMRFRIEMNDTYASRRLFDYQDGEANNDIATLSIDYTAGGGNQAPTETPPAPDISIANTATGLIEDLSGHVNDPEGDTLTYSVSPALPSGLSLNTSTGEISANGSVAITAAADYTFTVDDGNSNTLDIVINIEVTSAFAIVSAPSEIKATEGFTVRVSDPATVPTLGNTLVGFAASKIAPSSIDVIGGGVYDLNVTFPRTYPSVFSDTGFALEVTVNAETLSTSAIPYRPQTGYSFLTVASLNTSTEVYSQYSDTKPVNGDQAVYQPIVSPSGATVTLNPDTSWSIPDQTADQTSNLYFIQAAGTVGALDTITWAAPDTEAPVITLVGSDTINLVLGDPYTEQGATWTDNKDGSGSAIVSGDTVDTNTVGTYTIVYDYTDAAGNAAAQVSRTVVVSDVTAPVITLTGASEITVAFGSSYVEPGATATDNYDGDITGDIVITDNINPNASGTYTVSYNVQDSSGNAATERTRTVIIPPQSQVVIDSISESRTSAIINFSYAGTDITGFEYDIGGGYLPATSPLTLSGLTADTAYSIDIRPFNGAIKGQVTSDTFQTLPDTDSTPDAFSFANQTNQARAVYATSSSITVLGVDAGVDIPVSVASGEYSVSTDNGATWGAWTTTPTNVRLNYRVRVRHLTSSLYNTQVTSTLTIGGVSATFSSTTLPDTVAPVISLTGGNVTITQYDPWVEPGYSAIDNADGDISVSGVVITGSVDTDNPGTYVLTYTATDSAGNQSSTTRTVTVEPFVPADNTPPVISLIGGNVSITEGDPWVDPGYSAVDNVDGSVPVTVTGSVNTAVPGTYTLTYRAEDAAGNVSNVSRLVTVAAAVQYPLTANAPDKRTYIANRLNRIEKGEAVFIKQPDEILDYDFDLTEWLASENDTLPSDNFSVSVDSSFEIKNAGLIPGTSRVKVWLAGGAATSYGETYPVELTIITEGFRTAQFLIRIVVIDKVS